MMGDHRRPPPVPRACPPCGPPPRAKREVLGAGACLDCLFWGLESAARESFWSAAVGDKKTRSFRGGEAAKEGLSFGECAPARAEVFTGAGGVVCCFVLESISETMMA
jgi:hypothetical protein